ncbi:MAG: amylo-alpha-1,6-glucosidase [Candidatus Woesearchaeota archaeon]
MIITHKIKKNEISKNIVNTIDNNISIFLLNRRGHYFAIPSKPSDNLTNFDGWLNIFETKNGYSLYKSIDNIYLSKNVTNIVNNFNNIQRVSSDTTETFTLAKNGLIYDVNSYNEYIYLDLDFREIFDNNTSGRIYSISNQEDCIIIEYTKYSDDTLKDIINKFYLVIKGATNYELINNWSQKIYHYDVNRKNTSNFYIYNAIKIPCHKNIRLHFAFSSDKDLAISKAEDLYFNKESIDESNKDYVTNVLSLKNDIAQVSGNDSAFAYTNCIHAMDNLSMQLPIEYRRITGMWAGLPWFFQYWSRDELISVMSLLLEHRYDYGKELLMKYLSEIMNDGRLSNRYPAANLGTADSIGWLFKRLEDFLLLCEKRNNFNNYFTLFDLNMIRERLKFSIKTMLKEHSKDGLIFNDKQETWIDTFNSETFDKDYREGFRIEIQALFLNMLKLMNMLETYLANKYVKKNDKMVKIVTHELNTNLMEKSMRQLVRDRFFKKVDGKMYLNDGYDSSLSEVIRPNIFLAYYIYPQLLDTNEWIEVFDNALPKLWCEWNVTGQNLGGLSTIDKTHYLYQPYYTGLDNKSYHRGDSWFWINNIAAISMYRLDKEKYKDYISKIVALSSYDILYSGFIGYASELTSSGWFKSGGCLCQTWSIATFIELMHELYIE